MESINTLSELLIQSGTQFKVFDLGRRVQLVENQAFLDMEYLKTPYPYPLQQHAWVSIVFWHGSEKQSPFIWFLKLPLDESAMILPGPRNQFMQDIVTILGQSLNPENQRKHQQLEHHPLVFKPHPNKMAMLNAKVRQLFGLPQSDYYNDAKAYVESPQVCDWQKISIQGVSDLACHIHADGLAELLESNFTKLNSQFLESLSAAFEHIQVPGNIANKMLDCLSDSLTNSNHSTVVAMLRGLSHAQNKGLRHKAITMTLNCEACFHPDVFATLAGRYWLDLAEDEFRLTFFETVAKQPSEWQLFPQIFADLVSIPEIRNRILTIIREPNRSEHLASAIGMLFRGKNDTN